MSFHLEHEDDHSFHVRHPNGHVFQVAKAGLDAKVLKKIQAMKPIKMADGGEVPDFTENASRMPAPMDPADAITAEAKAASVRPEYERLLAMEQADSNPQKDAVYGSPEKRALQRLGEMDSAIANPMSVSPMALADARSLQAKLSAPPVSPATPGLTTAAPAAPGQAPQIGLASAGPAELQKGGGTTGGTPAQDQSGGMFDYMKQEMGGIQGVANAKAQQAKDVEKAYADYMKTAPSMDQMQKQAQMQRDEMMKLDQENQKLGEEIRAGKIDPNHAWASKSTGAKIGSIVGILISGLGAGWTGKNTALDILQREVDQDIDAQKANLDNKRGLLSQNMQRYGHLQQAVAATQLQMNQMLQNQISMAAARSGSKEAMANAQIAVGQLKERAMPIMMQLAAMRVQAQSLGAGSGQGGIPEGQEPVMLLSDPKYQEKRVVVNGRAYQARDKEAATELSTAESKIGPAKNLIDELERLGPSALIPGSPEYQKAQAIRASLAMTIPQMKGIKRLSEKEIEMGEEMVKDPTKFSQLMNGGARNKQFLKGAFDELESLRRTNLIGYKGIASLNTRKAGW